MAKEAVINDLKQVLADTYALYLKTQNYHWNVTGPNFIALHDMFESQYDDLAETIDTVAERIRALGPKAPGGFKVYSQLAKVADGDENADAATMVRHLADDHTQLAKTCQGALENAAAVGDEATFDLFVGRISEHEKTAWMLNSSL